MERAGRIGGRVVQGVYGGGACEGGEDGIGAASGGKLRVRVDGKLVSADVKPGKKPNGACHTRGQAGQQQMSLGIRLLNKKKQSSFS